MKNYQKKKKKLILTEKTERTISCTDCKPLVTINGIDIYIHTYRDNKEGVIVSKEGYTGALYFLSEDKLNGLSQDDIRKAIIRYANSKNIEHKNWTY